MYKKHLQTLYLWYSTRGPQKIFWNTQFLNKIRADIDKLMMEKTVPGI